MEMPHQRRRRRVRARRALIPCLASLLIVVSAATPAAASSASLSARVQRALDGVVTAGAPGAIALVRVGDRTIRLASGHSALAPEAPMRADLRARVGGITKSYTAAGVPDAGILGGWGLGLLRETFPCAEASGHDSECIGYMTAAWSSRSGTPGRRDRQQQLRP
jgi:hypothetical protein